MWLRPLTERWLPRAGNSPEEYEDAFRAAIPDHDPGADGGAALVAVADGASESAFAREWADALVEAFVSGPPDLTGLTDDSLHAWLDAPRERWRGQVPWDRLPWHGEAKARAGAFATLLGLTFEAAPGDASRLRWRALAVGDSCLFIVRDGRLALSFPLEDAAEFDNAPALICSNPASAAPPWDAVCRRDGACEAGDVFILASDALSCWFLALDAAGEQPWEALAALGPADWEAWVDAQRQAGLLGNDDTTLVAMEVVQTEADGAPCPGRG